MSREYEEDPLVGGHGSKDTERLEDEKRKKRNRLAVLGVYGRDVKSKEGDREVL